MSSKAARGEKRKCQNEDCGASYYDLNREEFDYPICGTTFDQEANASLLAQQQEAVPDCIRRKQPRELPIVNSDAGMEAGGDDNEAVEEGEVSDGEIVAEDETAATAAADILLEEDEDTSDPLSDAVPLSVSENENQ